MEFVKLKAQWSLLWPPDVKNCLTGRDPDAAKDWWQEEKGMTEDEMIGWHHRLNGHEFEQAPGINDGQGSLSCCSPWGCKEWDMIEWLNWRCTGHYVSVTILSVRSPTLYISLWNRHTIAQNSQVKKLKERKFT